MDEKDILNRIIQEEGNCCWSKKSICQKCPMSRLKQKSDGTYYSCAESIGIEFLTEEEADAKYKTVAEQLLLNKAIEDILENIDVIE